MARPRQRQILLMVALVLAIAGTFVFGYRAGRQARHLRRENEPVRAWMSVPFIAHTHHVDRKILFQAVGIPPVEHDHRPLRRIAREQHRPVGDLIQALEKAIQQSRASTGKGP